MAFGSSNYYMKSYYPFKNPLLISRQAFPHLYFFTNKVVYLGNNVCGYTLVPSVLLTIWAMVSRTRGLPGILSPLPQ